MITTSNNNIQVSRSALSGVFRVLMLAVFASVFAFTATLIMPATAEATISGYGDCVSCGWEPEYEVYNTYDYYDYGWEPEYEVYNTYDYYDYGWEPEYQTYNTYDYYTYDSGNYWGDYYYEPYYVDYSYGYYDYDYGGCYSNCYQPVEPVCAMSASDTTIEKGDDVTLHWTSENAYSATLSGYGSVATGGNRSVSPNKDTTYTLTVRGQGGTDTCSVRINVEEDEDEDDLWCELDVSDSRVEEGDEVTLEWDTRGASYASINQGVGRVDEDGGEEEVEVDRDTTFRLTVRDNDGDEETCTATVRVDDEDDFSSISFNGDPVNNPPTVYLSQLPYTGLEDMSPSLMAAIVMLAGLLGIGGYFFFVKRRTA